jgi:cytochrome c
VPYLKFLTALAMLCVAYADIGPASAAEYGTKDEAVALVKRAIARVNDVGFDTAKVEFMDKNGKFFDRDMYIIMVDMAGTRVVHGQNPKLIGKTYVDAVDVNGKAYGKDVMLIATGPGTGWVSFMFKDPITGKVLPKENYVEKAGDYIYLSGVYTR